MEIFVGEKENVIFCNPHSPEINSGQVFSADSYNFKRKAVEKIGILELQYANEVEKALKLVLGLGIDI